MTVQTGWTWTGLMTWMRRGGVQAQQRKSRNCSREKAETVAAEKQKLYIAGKKQKLHVHV